MEKVVNLPKVEKEELFRNSAAKIGMSEGIVEKDFWVCWALDYLFHSSPWAKNLGFKGGTSLSKCFHLIDRFSEDIDIILDWRILGYQADEPWIKRSRNKQDKFNKEVNSKTEVFLQETFLSQVQHDFAELLHDDFTLAIDDEDPQTVSFSYPKIFAEESLVQTVRMEIGALAAWTPVQKSIITPYAADAYPKVFSKRSTDILTVSPERTFWEKITIVHKEAFRENGHFPLRYSRHYYDLFCMDQTEVKQRAYANLDLLDRVVKFKDTFYPAGSAHYDLAKPGTIRLLPPAQYLDTVSDDYEHMKNMIFGKKPSFDEMMDCIKRLEREINDASMAK